MEATQRLWRVEVPASLQDSTSQTPTGAATVPFKRIAGQLPRLTVGKPEQSIGSPVPNVVLSTPEQVEPAYIRGLGNTWML